MKNKIYVLTIASSSEYGCDCRCVGVYKTKKDAVRALKKEYKMAKSDFDCDNLDAECGSVSFYVADYDCHADCISGRIDLFCE